MLLPWKLDCWTYDWTGDRFRRTCFTLMFEPYEGHRSLVALPYYPFALHPNYSIVGDSLIERGQKFRRLRNAKKRSRLFQYKGNIMFGKQGLVAYFKEMRWDYFF